MPARPSLLESLLALLFPERCAGCKRTGALLCTHCRSAIELYTDTLNALPGVDGVSIAYVYRDPLRTAIHQLKYRRRRRVAQPLGELLAPIAAPHIANIDAIQAIPMHAARLNERGFNQADLIARALGAAIKLPCLARGLVRVRATEQQVHLNAQERRENMRDAFAWRNPAPPPARVLLIDDVLTTGATMSACALALREAGCREIYGIALARSRLK